jgi:hypothetical protein
MIIAVQHALPDMETWKVIVEGKPVLQYSYRKNRILYEDLWPAKASVFH